MEPYITEEELSLIEKSFNDSTQDHWNFMLVRDGLEETNYVLQNPKDKNSPIIERKIQKLDPRWDVFTGPPLDEKELSEPKMIALKGRKQILHFHPESPAIFERCSNLKDGEFVVTAHDLVPKMIAEIKRLRSLVS